MAVMSASSCAVISSLTTRSAYLLGLRRRPRREARRPRRVALYIAAVVEFLEVPWRVDFVPMPIYSIFSMSRDWPYRRGGWVCLSSIRGVDDGDVLALLDVGT